MIEPYNESTAHRACISNDQKVSKLVFRPIYTESVSKYVLNKPPNNIQELKHESVTVPSPTTILVCV